MTGLVERRLRELEIELPEPSIPGANYVPFHIAGNLLVVTGQLSQWNGERRFVGKLGRDFTVEEGQKAARLSALNLIALARVATGDLDRIDRCLRLAGYINGTHDFTGHSQVMNGASDLFVDVFGEAGRHTRIAVGVNALPYDVAVEVEAMFTLKA